MTAPLFSEICKHIIAWVDQHVISCEVEGGVVVCFEELALLCQPSRSHISAELIS